MADVYASDIAAEFRHVSKTRTSCAPHMRQNFAAPKPYFSSTILLRSVPTLDLDLSTLPASIHTGGFCLAPMPSA
jgi:hypothetical protein